MPSPENQKQPNFTELRKQFHDDADNYELLRGERQLVRNETGAWDTDFTLERYTAATDRMIGILDGSIEARSITDPDNPEKAATKPDSVIWLDKSARPVSWLVDGLWEQYAESDAEKPDYEFLNIDRVNWFVSLGHKRVDAERRLGPSDFDINKVKDTDIARIRAYFTEGDLTEENWQEEVWNLPTRLDGKNILIVDEVMNRGGTLAIATQLIKRAVPEATVSGDYFWPRSVYSINGKSAESVDQQMESAPVWYDKTTSMGRGVGEISHDYWERMYKVNPTQDALRSKIAAFALSAPHHERTTLEPVDDVLADKLKQDIAYLSYAVGDKKVLRTVARERSPEQMDAILEDQNLTLPQYRGYREVRTKQPNTEK